MIAEPTSLARYGPNEPTPDETVGGQIAHRLRNRHPATAAACVLGVSYVVLVVLMAAIGLTITKVLTVDGRASWDVTGVNSWFADRLTPDRERWSGIGSNIAATFTIIAIAACVAGILLLARRWRPALFLAGALILEVTVFLTMTLVVPRERPAVPKPDAVPPTSSFPSGHTAAAVALYLGIAILLARQVRNVVARTAIIVAGVLPPIFVAVSRVARGMHHPTDVFAGALLGVLCLAAAALAVEVAGRVAARRRAAHTEEVVA